MRTYRMFNLVSLSIALVLSSCAGLVDDLATGAISAPLDEVAVPDSLLMTMSHGAEEVLMTRQWAVRPGDQARADALAADIEAGIAPYADIDAALEEGL